MRLKVLLRHLKVLWRKRSLSHLREKILSISSGLFELNFLLKSIMELTERKLEKL